MEWGLGLSGSTTLSLGPEQSVAMAPLSKHLLNEVIFITIQIIFCLPPWSFLCASHPACPLPCSGGFQDSRLPSQQLLVGSGKGRHWQMGLWDERRGASLPCSPPWSSQAPPSPLELLYMWLSFLLPLSLALPSAPPYPSALGTLFCPAQGGPFSKLAAAAAPS